MTISNKLHAHAERLLDEQTRLGESTRCPIELRRVITAAYYGAWHAVCDSMASKFHENLHSKLNRLPGHKAAVRAAKAIKDKSSSWQDDPCTDEMKKFCEEFTYLQNQRIQADYKIDYRVTFQIACDCVQASRSIADFVLTEAPGCKYYDMFLLECLTIKFQYGEGNT